jgi:2-polyprenyl-3-methyl-5-hydroxy-6-metoxy-1,4-benzoquinol methylase
MEQNNPFEQYLSSHLKVLYTESSFEATAQGYDWLTTYLPSDKNAAILDIGSGMGHFLYWLKSQGFTGFNGLEIGPEQVKFIKEKVTDRIILVTDTNRFLAGVPNKYALITMFNVIEHLPKPQILETLRLMYQALQPGGRLIITTGNMASATGLFARYMDFTHETGFTETSLKQILTLAGFTDIKYEPDAIRLHSINPKKILAYMAKHLYRAGLKLVYYMERPGVYRPKILAPVLRVIAQK